MLEWAVRESGLSFEDVAKSTKISKSELEEYLSGKREPNLTNFGKFRKLLKRPSAIFFLPEVPRPALPNMEFRHSPETERIGLNHRETLQIRMSDRQNRFTNNLSPSSRPPAAGRSKSVSDETKGRWSFLLMDMA